MLKLTKTGIGLLSKQYKSVLRKCFLLNLGITLFMTSIENSHAVVFQEPFYMGASSWAVNLGYDSNNFGYLSLYKSGGGAVSLNTDGLLVSLLNGRSSFLGAESFRLNGSSSATGIDFATNVTSGTTNDSHLATTGAVNQLLNYYYTFRVDERVEVIDSASFFQKDFSTLQEVDLQSKNPTHLGAFTKCDGVCPRPSERFSLSLSQEQMFKNNASVDAGTSRHCLRQFGDVVADLLKNTVAKSLRISEFMNEEVCHA